MLQSKDSGRYKHCHLFTVVDSFECCAYGDLCFSETYITANQPVHGSFGLHIRENIFNGFDLIGGFFMFKSCLKFPVKGIRFGKAKTLAKFS
jgi:hypothetical protein